MHVRAAISDLSHEIPAAIDLIGEATGRIDRLARIDPDIYEESLLKEGCREMDFTGRPMKGFVFVDPEGVDLDKDLESWIQWGLDFNPQARSSKKKKE